MARREVVIRERVIDLAAPCYAYIEITRIVEPSCAVTQPSLHVFTRVTGTTRPSTSNGIDSHSRPLAKCWPRAVARIQSARTTGPRPGNAAPPPPHPMERGTHAFRAKNRSGRDESRRRVPISMSNRHASVPPPPPPRRLSPPPHRRCVTQYVSRSWELEARPTR